VECGRFLEIWNLVFMTYFQHPDGSRTPLPAKNIDTGAGLERMAVVLQDVRSVYETDLFAPIIRRIEELCGHRYGQDAATDRAMRIVAEHTRAAAFLIGDDKTPVLPSNEERGYAVRRVLRRAVYYGRHYLGLDRPFMAEVANAVVEHMGQAYPELRQQKEFALRMVEGEESRFEQTLDRGAGVLEGVLRLRERHAPGLREALPFVDTRHPGAENASKVLRQHGFAWGVEGDQQQSMGEYKALELLEQKLYRYLELQDEGVDAAEPEVDLLRSWLTTWGDTISAEEGFFLHDTYGFPMELTREIARERGFTIDEEGFEQQMEAQRERARAAQRSVTVADSGRGADEVTVTKEGTPFLGYETLTSETTVVGLLAGGGQAESAAEGEAVEVILRETPFYAEAGGQVGDRGEIIGPHGRVRVDDTQRAAERLIVHRGRVVEGRIAVNDAVVAQVDEARRHDIMRNHTATHLLHAALRRVLGTHVRQAGSLVTPDRLRFDFTHLEALKPDELAAVQSLVNDRIRADLPVRTRQSSFDDAMAEGVLAFFDEKYGDQVRVVEVRQDGERYSGELCGGTHCSSTGQIGLCLVVGESSVGAGMRRIEALTGRGAEAYVAEHLATLHGASQRLGVAPSDLEPKLSSLLDDLEAARKQVQALERAVAAPAAAGLAERAQSVDGVAVLAARVEAPSQDTLRHMGDILRQRLGSAVIVLGATLGGRPTFMAMVTPDLVKRGLHAGHILKRVASAAGGGGGGRPEMAQGGGTDPTKLDEALSLVEPTVRELLAKKG
jgi:alanyl-tRNA synthetase